MRKTMKKNNFKKLLEKEVLNEAKGFYQRPQYQEDPDDPIIFSNDVPIEKVVNAIINSWGFDSAAPDNRAMALGNKGFAINLRDVAYEFKLTKKTPVTRKK